MDHTKLVQDLHQKLTDLDHKVQVYRRDLIADFQRHYHHALLDVSPDTAREVKQSVAQSLAAYPSLFSSPADVDLLSFNNLSIVNGTDSKSGSIIMGTENVDNITASNCASNCAGHRATLSNEPADSQVIVSEGGSGSAAGAGAGAGIGTGPGVHRRPAPPHAVFGAAAAARTGLLIESANTGAGRSHEREKEFQGLFTPSYLPLLDGSSSIYPPSPPVTANSDFVPPAAGTAAYGVTTGTTTMGSQGLGQAMEGPLARGPGEIGESAQQPEQLPDRPATTLKQTNQGTTSSLSDTTDSRQRRSALRRSSSSSNNNQSPKSPRRVRFDFEGVEVLPTASPLPTDNFPQRTSSPIPSEDLLESDAILGDGKEIEEQGMPDPPPRKISSSEALRALSRAPLDEGTVWTIVNPEADESATESQKGKMASPATEATAKDTPPAAPEPPRTTAVPPIRKPLTSLKSVRESPAEDSDDDSSDEDFISMGKPKSFSNKPSLQSAPAAPSTKSTKPVKSPKPAKPVIAAKPAGKAGIHRTASFSLGDDETSSDEDEEDEMFEFEGGGLSAPPRPKPAPPSPAEEEREPSPPLTDDKSDYSSAAYATSPAVPISRPRAGSGTSTPTTNKFQPGSIGSYKGRAVVMPVVKNEDLHAQAASLGEFNTFVGGLDGRSGMDEGDLNSFRASLVHTGFSGTPRSLTERMMLEDAMAERAVQSEAHQ